MSKIESDVQENIAQSQQLGEINADPARPVSSGWETFKSAVKIAGRVLAGVLTLGISELVRFIKGHKTEPRVTNAINHRLENNQNFRNLNLKQEHLISLSQKAHDDINQVTDKREKFEKVIDQIQKDVPRSTKYEINGEIYQDKYNNISSEDVGQRFTDKLREMIPDQNMLIACGSLLNQGVHAEILTKFSFSLAEYGVMVSNVPGGRQDYSIAGDNDKYSINNKMSLNAFCIENGAMKVISDITYEMNIEVTKTAEGNPQVNFTSVRAQINPKIDQNDPRWPAIERLRDFFRSD